MSITRYGGLTLVAVLVACASSAQNADTKTNYGADSLGATTGNFTETDGELLYQIACSGCHGPEGSGAYGAAAYPALADNPRLATARYPVNLMIEGNGAMPSFANWLDDDQVASITNYLRNNLGNDYEGSVTARDIALMREEFADLNGG